MSTTQTPSADPPADGDLEVLRDAVDGYVRRHADLKRIRALRGTDPGFDRTLWRELAGLGWLGAIHPEASGGQALGWREMAVIVRGCAGTLFPEPITASAVLAGRVLAGGDGGEAASALLAQLVAGDLVPALAWQEDAGGLAVDAAATTASATARGLVLQGTKRFVTPALGADGYLVSARGAGGLEVWWVPAGSAGLRVERELRADGTFAGLLRLEAVAVAADQRIASAAVAKGVLERSIAEATVMACVEALAVMERSLAITLEYLRTRVQFGKPIGSFQALQHRAVDLYVLQTLAASAVRSAVATLDGSSDATAALLAASRAKSRCADAAVRIARESIQLHGAIGFSDECDAGLYLQRALVLSAWLGNGTEHRRRYAALAAPEVPVDARTRAKAADGASRRTQAFPAAGRREPDPALRKDWNALSDEAFRAEVRACFEENYPDHLRYLLRRARWAETRDWYFEMSQKGWIAPHWPHEHGGMGLDPAKLLVFIEEQERLGVARPPDIGLVMVGPILMRYGTPEQKATYLPRILSGENIWCQGYSEPNAGSDLAALQTSAVAEGDHYVVNGQKIWTTLAHDATHMFLLARTDRTAKKRQEGISCFVLDLATPGVTVRPIRNIEGHEEFCQIFLDGVRIPQHNLVGELNQGWTVAKALLGFERLNHGSPKRAQYPLKRLEILARARGLLDDAEFVGRYTRLRLDVADLADTYAQFADAVRAGRAVGPEASMLKIWATETFQRLAELMIEAAGDAGALRGELAYGDDAIDITGPFYASFPATIAAGSSEIQRNILARRVLELPR